MSAVECWYNINSVKQLPMYYIFISVIILIINSKKTKLHLNIFKLIIEKKYVIVNLSTYK